ncbi:MAG TPA: hypothetical protein VG271_19820 [Beijerinckiaceae bacterium]|nr:hypothetical protein [Beijerinckiaceae bacterium]
MTIILDANLLLLLVVGMASRTYIATHQRLTAYTTDDFLLLRTFLSKAKWIVVTPNTLTEASNLVAYIADPARTRIYEVFRTLVKTPGIEEQYVESVIAVDRIEFLRLGLTDAALLHNTTASRVLLTADLDLYLAATKKGLQAENFNHLRFRSL